MNKLKQLMDRRKALKLAEANPEVKTPSPEVIEKVETKLKDEIKSFAKAKKKKKKTK